MKSSFAVGYRIGRVTKVILGVTSIMPNLNGVLLYVENGNHVQIENWELVQGNILPNMFISYEDKDEFEDIDNWEVTDCRL